MNKFQSIRNWIVCLVDLQFFEDCFFQSIIIIQDIRNFMCSAIVIKASSLNNLLLHPKQQEESQHTIRSKKSHSRSTSSQRSKYVSSSKLTKSCLFSTIRGNHKAEVEENLAQKNFQIELLQDTLHLAETEQKNVKRLFRNSLKNYRDEGRKLLRALEHFTQ